LTAFWLVQSLHQNNFSLVRDLKTLSSDWMEALGMPSNVCVCSHLSSLTPLALSHSLSHNQFSCAKQCCAHSRRQRRALQVQAQAQALQLVVVHAQAWWRPLSSRSRSRSRSHSRRNTMSRRMSRLFPAALAPVCALHRFAFLLLVLWVGRC
jgi:hypothetical protein